MNIKRNIISQDYTLREALERLNRLKGNEMTLFVVDSIDNLCVRGTLTDGDVRRALLKGVNLEDKVGEAMFPNFKRLYVDCKDWVDDIRSMRSLGLKLVPVLDKNGKLVRIIDLTEQPTSLPLSAILMAGGNGERMRPLTLETPKPLLKVDGKAIIDYNIESLVMAGINDITVCTRYLAEQIHEHFSKEICGVQVKCVTENEPLGTIGAVSLVNLPKEGNTLVMNSDLLTTVSFEDMYLKHRAVDADITIGVIPYQVSVPFAILSTEKDLVRGIVEKPAYSYYANGGIYIFNNKILSSLKPAQPKDAPELITDAISRGLRVTYHVINGTWIDVGSPTDFQQAQELMRHHRNLLRSSR